MAKDRLVDRIVVVSGDADLTPAMKAARREGVQVVLVALGHTVKASLREHADIYREIDLQKIVDEAFPTGLPDRWQQKTSEPAVSVTTTGAASRPAMPTIAAEVAAAIETLVATYYATLEQTDLNQIRPRLLAERRGFYGITTASYSGPRKQLSGASWDNTSAQIRLYRGTELLGSDVS
jgi:NYN domain